MNPTERLLAIFEELKHYVGRALHVGRLAKRITRPELAEMLRNKFEWKDADEATIELIEKDELEISFQQFSEMCSASGWSMEKMLNCAKDIYERDGAPDKELCQELMKEIDFELWKREQGSQ